MWCATHVVTRTVALATAPLAALQPTPERCIAMGVAAAFVSFALMGFGFISLSAVALFVPVLDDDLMMALGFGTLQVVVGVRIARRYGGLE